jgi:integral membrane sensor domain MASE1/CHASE1-domain containing sensor protein
MQSIDLGHNTIETPDSWAKLKNPGGPIFSNHYWLGLSLFTIAYVLVGRLGLLLATLNESASPVWPATGLAFGILLTCGFRFWPAIAIGAFITNYLSGTPVVAIIGITLGNTLEAFVGAWLIANLGAKPNLGPYARAIAIIAGSIPAAAVSATIGVLSLLAVQKLQWNLVTEVWVTWWVGNFLGGLIVTPLITEIFDRKPLAWPPFKELSAVSLVGIVLSWLIFTQTEGALFLYLLFPFIFWCVHIFERRGVVVLTSIVCAVAITSTAKHHGIFHIGNINSNLINLQILLGSLAITSLFLVEFKQLKVLKQIKELLLVGWSLSAALFISFYLHANHNLDQAFEKIVAVAEERLTAGTQKYLTALRSGVGLFAASQFVDRAEWRSFTEQMGSFNELSGLRGLGVVKRVPVNQIKEFTRTVVADQNEQFAYHGVPNGGLQTDQAFIITYIEPEIRNNLALGLDLATEPRRYRAAVQAMESGNATFSESITLVQDEQKRPGFLIYIPYYSKGPNPTTLAERRSRHQGWVYAPVVAENFFAAALGPDQLPELSYSIRFKHENEFIAKSADFESLTSQHQKTLDLTIAGQVFELSAKPSGFFKVDLESGSTWIGAIGAMLTLLLGALFAEMHSTNQRVNSLVDLKTKELELTGRMALVGGWEIDLLNQRIHWSDVTRSILEVSDSFTPNLMNHLMFYTDQFSHTTFQTAYVNAVEKGEGWDLELQVTSAQGREIWIKTIGRVRMENSRAIRILGAIQDITDRKSKELLLIQSGQMASLGEMASGVAHEINNPLAIINGKVAKLERLLRPPNIEKAQIQSELDKITDTVHRIAKIVKSLAIFSHQNGDAPLV